MLKIIITRSIGILFGFIASVKFPKFLQKIINTQYVKLTKANLNGFKDAPSYKSLVELFTRKIEIKRDILAKDNIFISPCDGIITQQGKIKDSMLLEIKGKEYSLKKFLFPLYLNTNTIDMLEGGEFINIYLSPGDYHRFHAPCDMKIKKVLHVKGTFCPVKPSFLQKSTKKVFEENERIILECTQRDTSRLFFISFIASLNVGNIVLHFEKRVKRFSKEFLSLYEYVDLKFDRGCELGYFRLGSTIVLLSEKNTLVPTLKEGSRVIFGDEIAKI